MAFDREQMTFYYSPMMIFETGLWDQARFVAEFMNLELIVIGALHEDNDR